MFQIYDSKMWRVHNDSTAHDVFYTASRDDKAVYLIMLKWPGDGIIGKCKFLHRI